MLRSSTWSSGSAMTRIQHVAQPVTEHVEGEADHQDRRAGDGGQCAAGQYEFARRREHRAPFRTRRLRAEPEKAKPGGGEDDRCHVERAAPDDRGNTDRNNWRETGP